MHDAERSSLGDLLGKIVEKGRAEESFALFMILDEANGWHASYTPPTGTKDPTTVYDNTAVGVLKKLCQALGLFPRYGIELQDDRTGEVIHVTPIWSVILDMNNLRYVHLGIEADDAEAAAHKVLETHNGRGIDGAEVYVFPNATMFSYLARQDTSYELVIQ